MTKKKSLGKGLANIYGDELYDVIDEIEKTGPSSEIAISEIRTNPYQPRKTFNDEGLQELASSINTHGLFTPILVRKSIGGYELIAGERRLRACKLNNMETISAIVVDFNDQQMMEISLLENIQRENLNAIEEAIAYEKMIESLGYTQELLAERINKSRTYVTNILRLLKLPKGVQNLVVEGKLSMGHVRPLITVKDDQMALDLAQKIISEGLSVRQVEALTKEESTPKTGTTSSRNQFKYAEELLTKKLQTSVKINDKQITIKYQGEEDLNRILEVIDCLED